MRCQHCYADIEQSPIDQVWRDTTYQTADCMPRMPHQPMPDAGPPPLPERHPRPEPGS